MADERRLLRVVDDGDVTVVEFAEPVCLDEAHVTAFTDEVTAIIAKHDPKTLELDLTNLELLTSTSLGILISIHATGVNVRLTNPNESVRDVFQVTHLDRLFEISNEEFRDVD